MFKKLSKWYSSILSRKNKVKTAVRKASGMSPTYKEIMELQKELLDSFYYSIFKSISKRNAGNLYSFGFKDGSDRPRFTARGAYLWRREINEPYLFNLGYYENSNNILTASLTRMHLQQDRELFARSMDRALFDSVDVNQSKFKLDDKGRALNLKSEEEYWKLYVDMAIIMPVYFFDQPDITFFLDHFYRALFKLIAMERLTSPGHIKEHLREELENELFFRSQVGFYPLNVATYTHLRNVLPERISKRMSSVLLKVKKMNQGDYISPIETARQASLR